MVIATAAPPAAVATPFVPALGAGDALPATALFDQRGRVFVIGAPRDGATVVAFFYARCPEPNECPLTSAKLASMQRLLRGDAAHLAEITLDPQHDTVAVLARYGATFGADPARWSLLRGDEASTAMLERRLGVAVSRRGAALEHDEALVVLDPRGRVADRIAGDGWTPREIAASVRALEREPADPFARVALALTRGIAAACGGAATASGISPLFALAVFIASAAAAAIALRLALVRRTPVR